MHLRFSTHSRTLARLLHHDIKFFILISIIFFHLLASWAEMLKKICLPQHSIKSESRLVRHAKILLLKFFVSEIFRSLRFLLLLPLLHHTIAPTATVAVENYYPLKIFFLHMHIHYKRDSVLPSGKSFSFLLKKHTQYLTSKKKWMKIFNVFSFLLNANFCLLCIFQYFYNV